VVIPLKVKSKNNITLYLFCLVLGICVGLIIWLLLKVMSVGTDFIWKTVPTYLSLPFYPVIICTLCGVLMGFIHKHFHNDYPDELQTVMYKVKNEKYYPYDKVLLIIPSILLPLICGASVGPEAGLTCLVACLCYWVGDNIKFAKANSAKYTTVGMSVALGLLFHSPLFGIFEPAEDNDDENIFKLPRGNNLFLYALAIVGALGVYALLSAMFGGGLGMSRFSETNTFSPADYAMIIVYISAGALLGILYHIFNKFAGIIFSKIPVFWREITGGLLLGLVGTILPLTMFSGESQTQDLMEGFMEYSPWLLILVAVVKLFVTSSCISSGLKGGHFFPLIFSGISLGYGVTMLASNFIQVDYVFGVAVVTAVVLGVAMKKPFAVTALLFILFPIKDIFWIFTAAAVGSRIPAVFLKKTAS